jgi:hypothetical protein
MKDDSVPEKSDFVSYQELYEYGSYGQKQEGEK